MGPDGSYDTLKNDYNILDPAQDSGALYATGNEVEANEGDSGGPQFINGLIAGVTSFGFTKHFLFQGLPILTANGEGTQLRQSCG